MKQRAVIVALLLVGVGIGVGATVFRADIAQATGLAQSVTVNNTEANPVPVREQGRVSVNGVVSAQPEAPRSPFKTAELVTIGASGVPLVDLGPSAVPVNITSMTVSSHYSFGVELVEKHVPGSATTCPFEYGPVVWLADKVSAPLTVAFPTPLQFSAPAGEKVCIIVHAYPITDSDEGHDVSVSASGFYGR